MSLIGSIRSQIRNVQQFRGLFPLGRLAKGAITLPLDYVNPTGWAAPPMVVNVLITSRCNMKCAMCSATDLRERNYREMSPDDLARIARQARAFRPSFFMGGGEPFARDDIVELIAAVKEQGHPLGVVTNGLRLDEDRGRRLQEVGLDHLMVSLHGPEAVHDTITGVPGAFRRVTENLEAFCRIKGPTRVMLNFVLSTDNVEHMSDLVDLGKKIGVDRVRIEHLLYMTDKDIASHDAWCDGHLSPEMKAALKVETFVCRQAAVEGFSEDLPRILREVREKYGDFVFIKPGLSDREIVRWYSPGYVSGRPCFFVWRSLFIDPEGFVLPCQHYTDMKFGSALREPILEIWNSPRYRQLRRQIRKDPPPACSRCCKT